MTNLELMICEAENNGEIDLDTRDIMLSILNESTAQARRSNPLTTKADSLRKSADDDERQAVNHELIGSMKSKIKAQKLRKQATNEWDNASKLDRAADKYDVMH